MTTPTPGRVPTGIDWVNEPEAIKAYHACDRGDIFFWEALEVAAQVALSRRSSGDEGRSDFDPIWEMQKHDACAKAQKWFGNPQPAPVDSEGQETDIYMDEALLDMILYAQGHGIALELCSPGTPACDVLDSWIESIPARDKAYRDIIVSIRRALLDSAFRNVEWRKPPNQTNAIDRTTDEP